jgi:hypothetical protein
MPSPAPPRSGHTIDADQLKVAVDNLRQIVPPGRIDRMRMQGEAISKAVLFCEFLAGRIRQCDEASSILGENGRLAPSLLLIRSMVEATIMLCWLHAKVLEFLKTKDRQAFERFLASGNFGAAGTTVLDQACNVVMTVDRFEREARGFKEQFSILCEATDLHYAAAIATPRVIPRSERPRSPDERLLKLMRGDAENIQSSCLIFAAQYIEKIGKALEEASIG